jgi:hypothetical protein
MKVSGTILQRYYNLPKTKVVGWVGQASRLPWKNQASQARRLRYTGRVSSHTSWFKVTELRGFHIHPNKIWNGLTGCPGNTGRINESKKMDQNTNLIRDNAFLVCDLCG